MIYKLLLTLSEFDYVFPSIAFTICFILGINRLKKFCIKDFEIELIDVQKLEG